MNNQNLLTKYLSESHEFGGRSTRDGHKKEDEGNKVDTQMVEGGGRCDPL